MPGPGRDRYLARRGGRMVQGGAGEPGARRVAVVTGSATGIGAVVARALGEAGYDVGVNWLHSRRRAEELARSIEAMGRRALAVRGDVSRREEVEALFDRYLDFFGRVDVLVNAAGPFTFEERPLLETTPEEWREMVDGNLSSVYWATRRVLPGMRERRWGRVINFGMTGSGAAGSYVRATAYAAAKSGLASLTRSLALSEAPYGITVNMVSPGLIRPAWKERRIGEARSARDAAIPVGRPGTGEDLARVVLFLCDEASDYLTGNVIEVTGGWRPEP
ncbi:MAG: SDR family oxidoreductase [Bacillota bacterium]|nr:SDR family oxidoreductase [Bacillota bacterium]